jgi:hypothetical protein
MFKSNKKLLLWSVTLSLLCVLGFQMPAPAEWQRPIQPSMSGGALTCLASHPFDRTKFFVASGQQVFESGKENVWQPLWSQSDASAPIKRLFSFGILPDHIFATTNRYVFMGNLKDRSWRVIYKDSVKAPLAFAVHPQDPNRWFLGTQKGLLETTNAGKSWSPSAAFHNSSPVPLVLFKEKRFFIGAENKLFLSLSGETAQQVFVLPQAEGELPETADNDGLVDSSPYYLCKIHDLIASKQNPQEMFLATAAGVFQSVDSGHHWEPLSRSGLQSADILQLAYSERKSLLYAATPRGVYVYDVRAQKWAGLFEGLARDRTRSIAILNEEKLLAITGEGFVQYPLVPFTPETGPALTIYQPPEETLALFKDLIALEPSAREIHRRVIRYADVASGKIKRWHASSRLAALLPNLSFSKNFSRGASIDIDRGGTNDPDKYIIGPADASKGGYRTLSWDFGDMIYSSDQTSIDSREKLMVELRNDLLSEATRIYYERRRLQIDLVFTPPVSEQEHLENLLRLDELAALLDGMTDGFLSKRLERIYNERPEFNALWTYVSDKREDGSTNK